MPSCESFLKPRKSRLGSLKSTFNAKNSICSFFMPISICFDAIRSWNVSRSPKSPKKSIKTLILAFKVIRCHWIRWQSRASYDFLLVINSNLSPISHRYWDTVTYCPKIANFPYPLSFNALVRYDLFRIYGQDLRLKLDFSRQPMVKIWWS